MGWVKLDDGFPMHPRVVGLSLEAKWAYIEALCYAARYETDGLVPDVVAANGPVRRELLDVGLWENRENGISIHDYLEYNPARAEQESKREAKSMAGAMGAAKRWGMHPSRPVPSNVKNIRSAWAEFWATYPRKVGKRAAEKAFERAVARASVEVVLAGARRFSADPNLPADKQFIPHPATWLNQDRWEDEPLPPRDRSAVELARDEERERRRREAERVIEEERRASAE